MGGVASLGCIYDEAPTAAATPDPIVPPVSELTPNPDAEANEANPEGLTVYVWEDADSFSHRTGAAELLRHAGFHVEPLALDQAPYDNSKDPSEDVDMIFIGSFISESEDYATYMAEYSDDLYIRL